MKEKRVYSWHLFLLHFEPVYAIIHSSLHTLTAEGRNDAPERGKKIDPKKIEQKLGIPVMLFSATDTKSYDTFYATLERALKEKSRINVSALEEEYAKIEGYQEIQRQISDCTIPGYTPMWLTVKTLEHSALQ